MQILSSISKEIITIDAVNYCINDIKKTGVQPSILLCYFTEEHDSSLLLSLLKQGFPHSKIHGCTSCQGVMTDEAFIDGTALGLWALFDSSNGSYGTSLIEHKHEDNIEAITFQALEHAILDSDRAGELPELILLHATPGNEEQIISAIDQYFGTSIPLIGGSAADNSVKGNWIILNQHKVSQSGISISVFYPSCKVSYSFHSGYAHSDFSGVVTKTRNRIIYEIDNRPVIDVYKEWTEMSFGYDESNNLLERVTQYPLGRIAGHMYSIPYFKLAHPMKFTHDGGMECFAHIEEGEHIFMMYGDTEEIITRPQRVINSARAWSDDEINPIGGINIFCAGSMMHIRTHMQTVCSSVNNSLHHAPYICPFTFGEQGKFSGGENAHGNLMVSTVLFHY